MSRFGCPETCSLNTSRKRFEDLVHSSDYATIGRVGGKSADSLLWETR